LVREWFLDGVGFYVGYGYWYFWIQKIRNNV
jgi:hypothetical protein